MESCLTAWSDEYRPCCTAVDGLVSEASGYPESMFRRIRHRVSFAGAPPGCACVIRTVCHDEHGPPARAP